MSYLEEITIIGYKSIRELKAFRLSSGLNVLIGANGSGKTNFPTSRSGFVTPTETFEIIRIKLKTETLRCRLQACTS